MKGKFNGISIRSITSRKVTPIDHGTILYSFRVAGNLPKLELEAVLRLQAPAVLRLGNETVEGLNARYTVDMVSGYEVTIEYLDLTGVKLPQ